MSLKNIFVLRQVTSMFNNLEKTEKLVSYVSAIILMNFIDSNHTCLTEEQLKNFMKTKDFTDAVLLKIEDLKGISTNFYSQLVKDEPLRLSSLNGHFKKMNASD